MSKRSQKSNTIDPVRELPPNDQKPRPSVNKLIFFDKIQILLIKIISSLANQKFESSEENKQIKCDHKLESKQTQNDNKTNNNGKSIGKKPDIKVYVPPKQTTNASNNSDKCEDKQSQRPVNNNERKTNTRSGI